MRANLILVVTLIACLAELVLVGKLAGFHPSGPRLAIQYFAFAGFLAFFLCMDNIGPALDRVERLGRTSRLVFLPVYFAGCLALAFGSLSVSQVAVHLLPDLASHGEWKIWPVMILSGLIATGVAMALRR